MMALCPACWRVVPIDATECPHCHVDMARLDQRPFREKLLGALSHPDRDTVVRAAAALAGRQDPEVVHAVESAIKRFSQEPHVVTELLNVLFDIDDEETRRIASDALKHPSFMVRRTATQLLEHLRQAQLERR